MSNRIYYDELRLLAGRKRAEFGVGTAAFGLREARKIYKHEGIRIDLWRLPYKIKALYMCADDDVSVALQKNLPDEPKLFALIHELKHHYCDRENLGQGVISCGDYNENELIEKGAEVFAAEFIYPTAEFSVDASAFKSTGWTAEDIVRFKRICKAKVSYRYLTKRLEWLGYVARGSLVDVQFKKLEETLFGVPFYRRKYAARRSQRA